MHQIKWSNGNKLKPNEDRRKVALIGFQGGDQKLGISDDLISDDLISDDLISDDLIMI